MNKKTGYFVILILAALALLTFARVKNNAPPLENISQAQSHLNIRPDYSDTTVPPNVAPLNFKITEPAKYYYVKVYCQNGQPIELFSQNPSIKIPKDKWHKLLSQNHSQVLTFEIMLNKEKSQWVRYPLIKNKIASQPIDPYLVYRRHHPTHFLYNGRMGIYQYDLENNIEKPILLNDRLGKASCTNCHTFCNYKPNKMVLAYRSESLGNGLFFANDGNLDKISQKLTYTSWHPSGKILAFSLNNVKQFFHSTNNEVRDAIDSDSTLGYYMVDSKEFKLPKPLSDKKVLETYPTWSPDGKYLYFCKAPVRWTSDKNMPPKTYKSNKYDIARISYDLKNDKWGQIETILPAVKTNSSNLLPRISPDNRWLLYCKCNYGTFPAFKDESDLYVIDLEQALQTGKYSPRKLNLNSDRSEAYHTFSSNSRWIVFSSKRRKGPFTRPYISYFNKDGKSTKPFILPQNDPEFLDYCLDTYTLPEFIIEPIPLQLGQIAKTIESNRNMNVTIPVTMASPIVTAENQSNGRWKSQE